jgi:phosphotransferase system HPr (HPr) family protein
MTVYKKFKILIYPGLHARPGSEFVKLCQSYKSSVTIKVDDKIANGKSLLSLFKIEPKQFSEIEIHVEGEDEMEIMNKLELWETEAYKNKEDFDNDQVGEEILKVFEVISFNE